MCPKTSVHTGLLCVQGMCKAASGCSVPSGLVARPAFTGDVTETTQRNRDRQYGGLYGPGHGHVKWRHSLRQKLIGSLKI